ncbi:MAG: hypothetical protein ACREAY_04230, partial [Nitrososphaera sp.]|uniref:hypothetical protein n=1 Tax=Nitrososphaera sp. TaxID=1971748 RepID=UPI003D6F2F58
AYRLDQVSLLATYTPTPLLLKAGKTYPVTVSDYLDSKFSHWDDGSAGTGRAITVNSDTTIAAHYKTWG